MFYSIEGRIASKGEGFFVLEAGGIGYKVFANMHTLKNLQSIETSVKIFTHLESREDALELYGFLSESELRFFELLISVSGVGPKSALAILDIAELDKLAAAIKENRPDLLARASGIGRKTAERIIVELKNKVAAEASQETVKTMQHDADILEALVGLGYRRDEAREALGKIDVKTSDLEARLKAALKILGKR